MAGAVEPRPLVETTFERPPEPTHRGRFRLAYVGLALVVWLSVGILVAVLARGGPDPVAAWSEWQPTARFGLDRAGEIAEHVAPRYRLATGDQLVGVQARAPELVSDAQTVPVEAVAVRAGISGQDIRVHSTERAVFFNLFGLGANSSIDTGSPSVARGTLLRREALELALYTFKYGDAESVVAFLPPSKVVSGGQEVEVNAALYFRRDDFAAQLARPVRETLPAHKPLVPGSLTRAEARRVARLTDPRSFGASFVPAQSGGAVLVLEPLLSAQ